MMYRLIVLTGPLTGQRITVSKEPMTIGRDADSGIVLPDEEVARQHARIEQTGPILFIRDLGSMNRLIVNKREVRESKLKHGDVVEIGHTRLLVQACVQAEVGGCAEGGRLPKRQALAVAAVLVALVAGNWWVRRPADEPAPEVASLSAAPVTVEPSSEEAAAPAAHPAEPPEAVSEEIRQVREQLAEIKSSVKDLAAKERAAAASSLSYPMMDPIRQKTQRMLEDARKAAEAGRFADADQILSNIQIVDPELLESYLQRALLFERRGMLKKAVEQWAEIEKRTMGTPLYDRAAAERARVARLDGQQAAESGRLLAIAGVDPQRFPQSDEFDEMRALKISLRADQPGQPLDADAVRVDVTFFDEDVHSGRILPSRFATTRADLRIEGAWAGDETKTVTATYAVPRGFREGQAERYYGYRVDVYYHDVLQDTTARPRTLLPADAESSGAPSQAPSNPPPAAASATS